MQVGETLSSDSMRDEKNVSGCPGLSKYQSHFGWVAIHLLLKNLGIGPY